jgi:methylenetetrahydrofolate dehydrogenase (NADP+)/methenyltetrahydrofolate cyclohydrolase
MTKILDGKVYSGLIKANVQESVEELKNHGIVPGLAVILVGNNKASQIYVRNKKHICEQVGIDSTEIVLDENVSKNKLLQVIDELNHNDNINGILLQLPLPDALKPYEMLFLSSIAADKDVDGFNPTNIGLLQCGAQYIAPCTPSGIMKMFELENITMSGKHVVIVGRSNIVGKPMAQLFLQHDATVTICHSKTENLADITKQADILVAAVGKPNFITKEMIKKDVIIVDVGINRVEDKLIGDVNFDDVQGIASYITPVPGGVGLLTTATLMYNTVRLTYFKHPELMESD